MTPLTRRLSAALLLAALVACGGRDHAARSPLAAGSASKELLAAFEAEARGTPADAVEQNLRALETAAKAPATAETTDVVLAALDALVHRRAIPTVGRPSALAARTDASKLDARLTSIEEAASGPFARGLVAEARLALAERRGDVAASKALRARTGCAREATLFGPVAYDTVQGVTRAPLAGNGHDALPATLPAPSPFAQAVSASTLTATGCYLPLHADTPARGVREVVVDVDVKEAGVVGLGMRAGAAAVLHAGGVVAAARPFSAGSADVLSLGAVQVDRPGTLRLVARVGMDRDHAVVELHAWDAEGRPLAAHASKPGTRADAHVARAVSLDPKGGDAVVSALARLAAGDAAEAEARLHVEATATSARPAALLAYARAVQRTPDLPDVKAQERARGAVTRLLEAWPDSWEAIVLQAELAGARRGQGEAAIESLASVREQRAKAKAPIRAGAWVDAYEAIVAGRAAMVDDAHAAAERVRAPLAGTPLWHEVERAAFERTGKEAVAFECDAAGRDHASLDCQRERMNVGDREGAEQELARLRALAEGPQLYLALSVRNAIERGDVATAQALLARMTPGDRSLSMAWSASGGALKAPEILGRAPVARDAPSAIAPVMRASGEDALAPFEGVAERVTSNVAGPSLAGAATAVLAHDERYDITPGGVLRVRILDVRRVMGTADVEANAQAPAPMLFGKDSLRILRRRIFKKDGRIVLPDETPNASQSHADLSQLEAGDAVEAIYEGFGIPGDAGNVGFDTPDLLPERTAVRDARIQITLPASLKVSLWSHPLLGNAEEKREGATRTLVYSLKDRPVRRLEMGVPKMDRAVGVSLSTTTWEDVAKGLRDAIAALDDAHPEVSAWARESSLGRGPSKELVAAVVEASGKAVKEASGMALADVDLGRAASAGAGTARTVLATHEGSRTWLVVRALHELGVKSDIVVAENEPFSGSPTFPPHFGRFMHALAVAHVPGGDVWIDADVPGPPLPAGRVSPELRGRLALWPDGRIAPLPAEVTQAAERDEVDIRLTVDEAGNAKGVLTVLLRGRAAQDIAEALERIVGLERQRALRGIALAWVPSATVEKVELSSTEGSWQVAIRAELACPAFAQVEGQKPAARTWSLPGLDPLHYVFPRPFVTTLSATYAASGARDSALAINRATQYHVHRRVELPKGATVARLPGPFDGKGPLLFAKRQMSVAGNTIDDEFVLEVTTGTVPRDGYDTFVAEARRTDDAFRASTRVVPPPATKR